MRNTVGGSCGGWCASSMDAAACGSADVVNGSPAGRECSSGSGQVEESVEDPRSELKCVNRHALIYAME
jgi:hypothetical protein